MAQKDPVKNGEMYRMIADTGGAFVQPALYEAFGLTVVEVSAIWHWQQEYKGMQLVLHEAFSLTVVGPHDV